MPVLVEENSERRKLQPLKREQAFEKKIQKDPECRRR